MIWQKTVSVLAGIAVVTAAAWATPERLTTSEDRLFAATQSHVYVLRDVIDNTGSHYASLQDQHLVAISLDSGEATGFWPLRRMSITNLDDQGDLVLPGVVVEREGETHDIMALLREAGAQPLSPHAFPDLVLQLEDGSLMREDVQLATPFAIRAAGRAQLAILRDAYPPIESEEEYRAAERIDFYNLYAEGDWLCQLRPERHTIFRPGEKISLVKIFCEDADLTGAWSFHLLIRDDL